MKYVSQPKSIFILGIKGVGMANLAVILKKLGHSVTGSDTPEKFITDELLEANGIPVIESFNKKDLPDNVALFVYSAANKGIDNPQAQAAKERGIPLVPQTSIIGEIMQLCKHAIAVAGCHGKTTTTSLLAYALEKLGVDPGYFIGTSQFENKWAGNFNSADYFVVEADEYGVNPPLDKTPKFLLLHPTHILCLNIDFDHPDVYKDIQHTKDAFTSFFIHNSATLVVNADNKALMEVVATCDPNSYKTYGFSDSANYQIVNPVITEYFSEFELIDRADKKNLGVFQISLFGEHNISNAAGVVVMLMNLGFDVKDIRQAINGFTGAKRRFEKVAEENGVLVFDDYGHHPAELISTITSAKARFKDRRIIVIFQPHTYSRTEILKYEFVDALSLADLAIIAPIFASAREQKNKNMISSTDLAVIAKEKFLNTIVSYTSHDELMKILKNNIKQGDVIFTIGAGDIYKVKNDIIKVIQSL